LSVLPLMNSTLIEMKPLLAEALGDSEEKIG
jgi:hypothetical protein